MYETWYKMTVMLQSGLDITPAITHRFGFREHVARVRGGPARRLGQGHHGLDVMSAAQPGPAGRPDPLAFSSTYEGGRPCASATCTGACGVMSVSPGSDRVDRRPAPDQPLLE